MTDPLVESVARAMHELALDDEKWEELPQDDREAYLLLAHSAIAAYRKMTGWRPISEAPRDGTVFLVDCEIVDCDMTLAYFNDAGVLVSVWDGKAFTRHKATHWQSLPSPPAQKKPE